MRIVVGATVHPVPPADGVQLHIWHVLKQLRGRHEITLVSLVGPDDDTSAAAVEPLCTSFRPVPAPPPERGLDLLRVELATLASGRPKVVEKLQRSRLPAEVRKAVQDLQPDVVHLETGAAASFVDQLSPPSVVVPLDADDLNAPAKERYAGGALRRWLAQREGDRWQQFERTAYSRCAAVVVVTERDAAALRAGDPRLQPHVVPNGVDTTWFTPPGVPRASNTVLLHGAMDYPPNVDAAIFAAREVMPRLRVLRPDARLVLAGRNPEPRVRALADDDVEVTGELPDLRPRLQSAAVYLCPMRVGSGIKNKLLEAWACGCPSVATNLATAGTGAVAGRDVLVAEDADGLATALDRVLADPDGLAATIGASARARAEALSWQETAASFERIYEEVAARSEDGEQSGRSPGPRPPQRSG